MFVRLTSQLLGGLGTSTEDPPHVRPTDKPASWGLDERDNIPTGIPTSYKPAPSPSCTLTVNNPTPTMKGGVKIMHASTSTVRSITIVEDVCLSLASHRLWIANGRLLRQFVE